uniref:Uncharacterized protein n=1 Tax=viral metagenome TaxID=1070528 RepID=A0A6M3LEF9_9ZZZZ
MATTDEKLIKAIEVLADKITSEIKADDALKFTQAAQNAANTAICLKNKDMM